MGSLHDFKSGYNFGSKWLTRLGGSFAGRQTEISHWNTLVENFSMSPADFYAAVERAMAERQIPGMEVSRVAWQEGGILSTRREYLRAFRDYYTVDICAAPFGTGFFFSYRVSMQRKGLTVFHLLGMATLFLWVVIPLLMVGLWFYARHRGVSRERRRTALREYLLGLTIIGPIIEMRQPFSYYQLDTAAMFQTAVRNAVMEIVGELTQDPTGVRGPSELEPQPILGEMLHHS